MISARSTKRHERTALFRAVSCDFVDRAFRPSLIDALLRLESSVDAEHMSGYKLSAFLPIVMARQLGVDSCFSNSCESVEVFV
jgi:hypothetical protein